jgi:hypothetical protein
MARFARRLRRSKTIDSLETSETYGPPRLQVILSSAPFSVCFNVSGLGLLSPAKMEIRASRSS